MNSNSSSSSSGVGFTGLLGVALIVLKLLGVIRWSWFWVLCPLWIGFVLLVVILMIAALTTFRV